MQAMGFDIGGTNIKVGLVNTAGDVSEFREYKTSEYSQISDLFIKVRDDYDKFLPQVSGIGISAPNVDFFTGVMKNTTNLKWGEINFPNTIEEVFNRPCKAQNDANSYTWGEYNFGQAKGLDNFVLLTLGTGLGSGIVSNGSLIVGDHGLASELGHIVVERDNKRPCGCGGVGHAESYISRLGMEKTILELNLGNGEIEDFYNLAKSGDENALRLFQVTGTYLGRLIAGICNTTGPSQIVLAGGISPSYELMKESCLEAIDQEIFPNFKGSFEIILSKFNGKTGPVIGAASLILGKPIN